MKPLFILCFTLMASTVQGQEIGQKLIGSWILTSRTYKSGQELPANMNLKKSFIRFEFADNGKAYKSLDPMDKGLIFDYSVNGNILKIGFLNYRIERFTSDSLILLEENKGVFSESSIKYSFVCESIHQRNIPLTSDMMIISNNDTTYIENEKVRLNFKNIDSFEKYFSKNYSQYASPGMDYFFVSTFIINADGSIDSIKIHKSMNKEFDKHFIEIVEKSKGLWIPGKVNGRNVKTLHKTVFAFPSKNNFFDYYMNFVDGIILIEERNFVEAINRLNIYLNSAPNDIEAIYNRGLCYFRMNDFVNARADWQKIKNRKPYKSYIIIKNLFE